MFDGMMDEKCGKQGCTDWANHAGPCTPAPCPDMEPGNSADGDKQMSNLYVPKAQYEAMKAKLEAQLKDCGDRLTSAVKSYEEDDKRIAQLEAQLAAALKMESGNSAEKCAFVWLEGGRHVCGERTAGHAGQPHRCEVCSATVKSENLAAALNQSKGALE